MVNVSLADKEPLDFRSRRSRSAKTVEKMRPFDDWLAFLDDSHFYSIYNWFGGYTSKGEFQVLIAERVAHLARSRTMWSLTKSEYSLMLKRLSY
jgi:hypothetical protein